MEFIATDIKDVVVIEPQVFSDDRGFFMETWTRQKFKDAGIDYDFVQDNHSKSLKGVLRGLHYQIQNPQGKLVRVLSGEVYDVAVDMRKSSPTFGKWVAEILSGENKKMLWVPPGFAHGFYVMSDEAEFVYKCTDVYSPEFERSLIWNDSTVNVNWPIPEGQTPTLSPKDEAGKPFDQAEAYD